MRSPRTLGQDRYWLLSRPSWEKTFNHCRLLQQVPIHLPSGICTSFQDHQPSQRTLHSWRHTCHCDVWQWPSIQWRWIQKVCSRIWLHAHHIITSFPPVQWFHQGHGEESQDMPTRKLMDLQMLKQEHYFSYETPLSWQIFLLQLKYFMDDQHKEQSFQDPQNQSTYIRLAETHWNTEHTEGTVWQST